MTLSSGASLKKVKAQAGRKKPSQALKRRVKAISSPQNEDDLEQSSTDKVLDHRQASNCSAQGQQGAFADTRASDIQSALVDHTGLADVLSSTASTTFGFPPYTRSLPAASPYRQRLEEIQHRRAESERLQRALASNSHLQVVVFCHRNDAYNFLPDGASITDMGAEGDNVSKAHATTSEANIAPSLVDDDTSLACSDSLTPSGSVEAGATISNRKKQSKKQSRAIAKKTSLTAKSCTSYNRSQDSSLAESGTNTQTDNAADIESKKSASAINARSGSSSQSAPQEVVEASRMASWDDHLSISAHSPATLAKEPCSSPSLSPQHQVEGKGKQKNGKGASRRTGSTPSSSRPSSRISGTTDASEASELDLGQLLLSSQAAAAVGSRSVFTTMTKAQRRRAKMKQSSHLPDAQHAEGQRLLQDVKGRDDPALPAERTHQVRRLHIGPLPQSSGESSRERPSAAVNTASTSRVPTIPSKSRAKGTAIRTSSSASSTQPPNPASWNLKGTSEDAPNHLRGYTTDPTAGQLIPVGVADTRKEKESSLVGESTPPVVVISGSSSTATDSSQTRTRTIPGAPPTALASNKEIPTSASKPQREKERTRLARERKQQELHRRRIAEAVAAAERGEKLFIPPQEPQRDAEAARHKKARPVVSVPSQDCKPTEGTVASAEVPESFSPRSRESAISKTETDDSYHTAASNILTSSPAAKSPREESENSFDRQSDEGELMDSSSVRSAAPSMLFSPLSTGSATITCFSPLETPHAIDTPQRPHWYPDLEQGQSSQRPSLSKHVLSSGDRKYSLSHTDTTDTSEVTGSQYGPSPPSDTSVDFGCPDSNALNQKWYPLQINAGANLTSSKLHDLLTVPTPVNEHYDISLEAICNCAQRSEVSSGPPLDKAADKSRPPRDSSEVPGKDARVCPCSNAVSLVADRGAPVFLQGPMTAQLHQQRLPPACSVKPHRSAEASPAVTTEQNYNTAHRQPAAPMASPPSSLTVIPEPPESNGSEPSQRVERASDTRHCTSGAASSRPSTIVSRSESQAVPFHRPLPARSMLPTATPDLTDPEQLNVFKRCVSELNAFEDDHQRRSRAREERLARLHCYDLEGFVETKRTVVETDGPSKGRKRIVRLWRTHSMLAPGRRLSAKFDFDNSVAIAVSKGNHRPANGTGALRLQGRDNAGALRQSSQTALAGSSSWPDSLSRLLLRHQRPAFAPPGDVPVSACDTSGCNVSRGSVPPDPLIEHHWSLEGIRAIRPSGLVRSFLEDASVASSGPFEDTTECVLRSGSTSIDARPDLNWLDSLRCLDEPERAALRYFLRAQEGESDDPSATEVLERGTHVADQAFASGRVAQALIPPVYPTMGNVTGPNGQVAFEDEWDLGASQLRRPSSNSSATYWLPEPSLPYEMATSAMSSPQGSLFAVNGRQAPHYEHHYSSSPHLMPTSSQLRPPPLPRQTKGVGQRARSREAAGGTVWSPVPPPAQSYHSDGSDLAHYTGPTSPRTEPELQMEALVAAVQKCLSAEGSAHEVGSTALPRNHHTRASPSEPASEDMASRYASSSAAEDRASSAGEWSARDQDWTGPIPDSAGRHAPSRTRLSTYAQQQQGHSTTFFDPRRDPPSSAHIFREQKGLDSSARGPQRQMNHPTTWQPQDMPQGSAWSTLGRGASTAQQEQARSTAAESSNCCFSAQPLSSSDLAIPSSSTWYAQPESHRQEAKRWRGHVYNELPRTQTIYPPHSPSPLAGPQSSLQPSGMVSSHPEAYGGTQVEGFPPARYGLAPDLERNHAYSEDHAGRLTSTYGQRLHDSTQELQNESRRAVQEEAAMLYAYGSRLQAARGAIHPSRDSRSEVGQASRHEEQNPSGFSHRHQPSSVEDQTRSRNLLTPSDERAHSRSPSSTRQQRSSSRSEAQGYGAVRPSDAPIPASTTNPRTRDLHPNMRYDAGPSHRSNCINDDREDTQRRKQQQRLYHLQQSDSDLAGRFSSHATRQYTAAPSGPSTPGRDEDQTVRIDRGRVAPPHPSQEQQPRARQQSLGQQARLPPRPSGGGVDAASAWDEPQRPEATSYAPQQHQQRPQQHTSSANDTRQRAPHEQGQRPDLMPNRPEQQQQSSSYDTSQRGGMRSDGHAQRGGGGRGKSYRGGWKQHRWEDREPNGYDRTSGSAGAASEDYTGTGNAYTGHGGRAGGEAGSGARGRGVPTRFGQR